MITSGNWMRYKRPAIDAYGGVCKVCGESDIQHLTLHHDRNNGTAERTFLGGGSSRYYRFLKRAGYPQDLQLVVLCKRHHTRYWRRYLDVSKPLEKEKVSMYNVISSLEIPSSLDTGNTAGVNRPAFRPEGANV